MSGPGAMPPGAPVRRLNVDFARPKAITKGGAKTEHSGKIAKNSSTRFADDGTGGRALPRLDPGAQALDPPGETPGLQDRRGSRADRPRGLPALPARARHAPVPAAGPGPRDP